MCCFHRNTSLIHYFFTGYSSDTDSFPEKSLSLQGISNTDDGHQASNGILATPMLVNTKLVRRTNLKTKEDAMDDTQKSLSSNVTVEDENNALNHSVITFGNVGTTLSKRQRNVEGEKVWYKNKQARNTCKRNSQTALFKLLEIL